MRRDFSSESLSQIQRGAGGWPERSSGASTRRRAARAPIPRSFCLWPFGLLAAFVTGPASFAQSAPDPAYSAHIRPFLETYCISCHGPEKQKADRRYDTLGTNLTANDILQLWQDILDMLNRGEMPPTEAKQPDGVQTKVVIDWITANLKTARVVRATTGGRTVLRRLNRVEYDRTVRHLLSLEDMLTDPTESFPPDETTHHLNNIGATLVTSDFLLKQYLAAAETFIERAAATGPKPEVQKYRFTAPFCPPGNRKDGLDVPGQYQHIRKNTTDEGGHLWLLRFPQGVPEAGWFTLRLKAQAINRNYPYDERLVGPRKDEPLRVAVVAGSRQYGNLESRTTSDRKLAEFELPDDAPKWFETRIWLDAGYQPRLTFPNGPSRVKSLRQPLVRNFPEQFTDFIENHLQPGDNELPPGYDTSRLKRRAKPPAETGKMKAGGKIDSAAGYDDKNSQDAWAAFFRGYQGPRVRVFEIEIEGPINEQWPTKSYASLFGGHTATLANADAILRQFATRAFRRPVRADELKVLTDLVGQRLARGDSELNALKAGFKAILCSPGFLYLQENEGELDDYALASRLSYFLWSGMPDDKLIALAASGELRKPIVLEAQTRRMLADPKAGALTEHFTSRWLELYKIGSMPPDAVAFRNYYVDGLEEAMKQETRLFFKSVLDGNLPIDRFLDSDFAFVNGGLARLYGIPGVTGAQFQRVSLPDGRRGGLLGQASVLTASANGIDTSPVIRGVWVLENILGTPPNPPPPDVKPLEPDIRGATTIREQLKKHRDVAACAECHRKIDPPGFALENFDPIGAWRTSYGRGRATSLPVDSTGQLPDGRAFTDIVGLKKILLTRCDQFARCLTEKMLAYSIGRTLEPSDRQDVARIVDDAKAKGYGLRDLLLATVQSEPFRNK